MENFNFSGEDADPAFTRKRLIASGAFGEVHEVNFLSPK